MVHIVGAGPGDEELITVKGARLLGAADVVIYAGSLVNRALLRSAGKDAKIFDSASMTLDEVIEVIKEAEEKGKTTVRLHTGDPALYGAIQEQMERMDELDIEYDVTPGVSSFLGAAASLKQEYTLPDVTQTVIITRMGGRTPVPEKENLKELSAHGATMCIFLSVGMIEEAAKEILAGGEYDENTPVVVVEKATWDDERIIRGTLGSIGRKVKEAGIRKTAMIVVGNCLQKKFSLSRLYSPDFSHEYRR